LNDRGPGEVEGDSWPQLGQRQAAGRQMGLHNATVACHDE